MVNYCSQKDSRVNLNLITIFRFWPFSWGDTSLYFTPSYSAYRDDHLKKKLPKRTSFWLDINGLNRPTRTKTVFVSEKTLQCGLCHMTTTWPPRDHPHIQSKQPINSKPQNHTRGKNREKVSRIARVWNFVFWRTWADMIRILKLIIISAQGTLQLSSK